MRSRILIQTLAVALIATTSLTGCAWWRNHFGPKAGQPGGQPPPLTDAGVGTLPGERPEITGDRVHGDFPPVYFAYDSALVKPSEYSKLETVAAALKGNSKRLVIEGHTDERGTAEYNRALGERRAQSALKALVSLGIAADRMSTVSYGKDRPADLAHDDTAWSRNRRCEFLLVNQ